MPLKDLSLALLTIVAWGLNFAVIKLGVAGVPPMLLAALRFVFAVFPAILFFRAPPVPLRLYLAYGMLISVGQFALLFTAIHVGMPTGLASLVLQAQAFFTLVFAALFLGEHWKRSQLAGLVLAGTGLALIGSSHGQAMPLLGFALTLGAAAAWAGGNIVSRAVSRHGPINQLAFVVWSSLVPIGPFLLLSWVFEGPDAIRDALSGLNLTSVASVAYLAWAATLFGYGVWTWLLSRHPANRVAPFSLLVPLVGLSTGWIVFGEALRPVHFVGGALLMGGLLLNLFGDRLLRRRQPA